MTTHGPLIDLHRTLDRVTDLREGERSEVLRDLHARAAEIKRDAQRLIDAIEAAAFDHIVATGQDIQLSETARWTIGKDKKVKSLDDTAILHAILEATQGDVARLTTGANGVLGSQPWKPATVKQIIGAEAFERLFKTEYSEQLRLKVVDEHAITQFRK